MVRPDRARTARAARALPAAAAFVLCGTAARRAAVSSAEARSYEAINGLPAALYPAVWTVMQVGSLGGVAGAGAAAAVVRRPRLATDLLVLGSANWVFAKGVKRLVRRGRPSATLDSSRTLGRPQAGLGYPSGHAAVAATLAAVLSPNVARGWRLPLWAVAALAGCGRVYVGAHLPLDIVGGIALGSAVAGAMARESVA